MTKKTSKSMSYGQYCPLALASELLCRRWTVLVISRLLDGCRTFNQIHQGIPRISPSLLSTRLAELEHAGLVKRRKVPNENRYRYEPTEAALDLTELIDQMAIWGQHWARDMDMDDLDPAFLAWSMSLRMNTDAMPLGRTVVEFEFSGTPTGFRRFWLVNNGGKVDMCLKDPGFETDLHVRSDIRCFVEAWRGFRDLRQEIRTGKIRLSGPKHLVSSFPDWLLLSALAPYRRRVNGRERRLYSAE
ncbi:MAG: helix-turn-helix domain-containing protein [Sedimenticolaceae bacterium]